MTYPILYVATLPDGMAGMSNGPVIRILESHRGDEGRS